MASCIICGRALTDRSKLMSMGNMPASAQDIPTLEECKTESGITLNLHQCPGCGLIQFDCEPVYYYKKVIRSSGFSSTMRQIRRKQYEKFIDLCNLKGKRVIEIGAGRGEFLAFFEGFDVDAYGIEYAEESVNAARENGLKVFQGYADDENTVMEGAPYDAFTSFNFLEHQPDPNGMMQAIYQNLTEDGVGLITVPSFEYIEKNDGFYELIRDHLAYYTFDTLTFLLNKNGFEVIDREVINRDTLAVIVKKRKKVEVQRLQESYHVISTEVNQYIDEFFRRGGGKKVAIWGASHQGFTIAATLNLGKKVEYIIDSADFKQGKYAPAAHIPIVAPDYFLEKPVDAILIIAPGYTEEIADIIARKYGSEVKVAALKTNHIEIIR